MQLPLAVWIGVGVFALVLSALCALTIYAILRRPTRPRLAHWPASWVVSLIVIATIPWVVVVFAPINVQLKVHGKLQLAGWILVLLIAFALLVLLPVAALLIAAVWWSERRRVRTTTSQPVQASGIQKSERLVDIFFYGLFMDEKLLRDKGVHPTDIRRAALPGHALRIGARATLVPDPDGAAHGLLMKLTHADVEKLYAEPSVRVYRPETVLVVLEDGPTVAALCYNLPEPPSHDERNAEYAAKLRALAARVGLPAEYVASIQ
jgi:hypothetical protein